MNSNIMKKAVLIIPLAMLLLIGCRKANNPTVFSLGIDMHETFEQDNVRVFIDNQPLLNKQVTTNSSLGFGGSVSTANTEGNHTIKVIVNDNTVATEEFTQHGDLYIGVAFNKSTNTVRFVYSPHRFVYD
jgi:hypothetical protein